MDFTKMSFEEFNGDNIKEHYNKMERIIDDGDWQILRDKESRGFFVNALYNHDFYEVVPVAKLEYDVLCDIQCKNEVLFDMFSYTNYDFCGEQVTDDKIYFWWFKEVV